MKTYINYFVVTAFLLLFGRVVFADFEMIVYVHSENIGEPHTYSHNVLPEIQGKYNDDGGDSIRFVLNGGGRGTFWYNSGMSEQFTWGVRLDENGEPELMRDWFGSFYAEQKDVIDACYLVGLYFDVESRWRNDNTTVATSRADMVCIDLEAGVAHKGEHRIFDKASVLPFSNSDPHPRTDVKPVEPVEPVAVSQENRVLEFGNAGNTPSSEFTEASQGWEFESSDDPLAFEDGPKVDTSEPDCSRPETLSSLQLGTTCYRGPGTPGEVADIGGKFVPSEVPGHEGQTVKVCFGENYLIDCSVNEKKAYHKHVKAKKAKQCSSGNCCGPTLGNGVVNFSHPNCPVLPDTEKECLGYFGLNLSCDGLKNWLDRNRATGIGVRG